MNSKQLLILVVVLAVLGGAGVVLMKKDSASWKAGAAGNGAQLLGDLPVGEELAEFQIQSGSNTLTLAKVEGVWSVKQRGDYPADYSEISRTVLKLRDLKAAQTEQVSESQLARLELLPPDSEYGGGTLLEFKDKSDKKLASLMLGKQQTRKESRPSQFGGAGEEMEIPEARWVMNPEDKSLVALVSDPLSNLKPTPESWLNKDFFKVQKTKSVSVNYPEEGTNSFELKRETESGPWALAEMGEDKELDTSKTSGFNYALSSPSFNDVIVDPDDAELGLDNPTVITIETFEGFNYEILAGKKQGDNYPMRVSVKGDYPREREAGEGEDESVKAEKDKTFAETLKTRDEKLAREQALGKWTYMVSSWTLDSLLKKRGELVKAKEEEKPAEETTDEPASSAEDGGGE